MDHDLLIVFKGFNAQDARDEFQHLLAQVRHLTFEMPDIGFDITAYFEVAKQYKAKYRYFCFLNSFSIIQDHAWLSKLYQNVSRLGVGAAGATGSWESHRISKLVGFDLVLIASQHYRLHEGKAIWKRLFLATMGAFRLGGLLWGCKPFPNYHLRTNAFIISSETMLKLKCPVLESKFDAYLFESGKNGLTQQILKMGKEVLVVGKDGVGYDKVRWNESKTFRQSDQENLLVADNQTQMYQQADAETRLRLSQLAWGNRFNAIVGQPK